MLRYPHMGPKDYEIWDDFLESFPDRFDRYGYDVRVGQGEIAPEDVVSVKDRMRRELTRKRIDVVAWRNDVPTVIEVKPYCTTSTLGQVLAYRWLYRVEFDLPQLPSGAVACRRVDPDISYVANSQGIEVIIVPEVT